MARSQPQIRTGVTNDPGRRDRRASRKLFDTLLCPAFSYTAVPCPVPLCLSFRGWIPDAATHISFHGGS